jgi:sulfite reductase (NADPH) hemoprotein beta-component
VFKEAVKSEELVNELRPLLSRFRDQRNPNERFGDFCARVIWPEIPAASH